jgi:hypothetical protein
MNGPNKALCLLLSSLAIGCGGPSHDERENRKALELLLTAVSLRSSKELDKDARRIDERHDSGMMSDARHGELRAIIEKARAGEWGEAERMAYGFRETHPYFQ